MNFTAVRGFNAYAQFSAKIREAAKKKSDIAPEQEKETDSISVYSEPVDIVNISEPAREASTALTVLREKAPQLELREWMRTSNIFSGGYSKTIPGNLMNEILTGSDIAVEDDEEYALNFDLSATITVSSRNAEKAKAIQDLLTSTPSGINWGVLLAKLPPM